MDATRIILQGEEAKFKIAIADFDMSEGDFKLELIYGYRRTVVEIDKTQMFADTGGNWYFVFDTDTMVGKVTARCTWDIADTDASGEVREKVNEQYLCFVVSNPCPKFFTCPDCAEDTQVVYTRTEESGIAELYYRLCDFYGHPITTSNDEYMLVLKDAVEELESNND